MFNNKDNIQCLTYIKNEIYEKCYMFKFYHFHSLPYFAHADKIILNVLFSGRNIASFHSNNPHKGMQSLAIFL